MQSTACATTSVPAPPAIPVPQARNQAIQWRAHNRCSRAATTSASSKDATELLGNVRNDAHAHIAKTIPTNGIERTTPHALQSIDR
mmetsp:Transcript_20197/g.42766  ORF Transcript_20197/g.42766 Transcript_20197/m.42766 type:complete len:86 (+) Transcript_20197:365-622(+)